MNLHYIEKMKGFVDLNFAIFFKGNGNFAILFFQWLEFRVFFIVLPVLWFYYSKRINKFV